MRPIPRPFATRQSNEWPCRILALLQAGGGPPAADAHHHAVAADQIGVPYRRYALDHRALVAAQIKVARQFNFDFVSCISDPAREAADAGRILLILTISRRLCLRERPC